MKRNPKNRPHLFLVCIILAAMSGCKKDELRGRDYLRYVENERNNLNNTKQVGDLHFQLQYCPTEYLLLKEFKTASLPTQLVQERKKDNEGLHFFKLRISGDKNHDVLNYQLSSGEDYYSRVQYLSYGFEENIALINQQDTIFPALFHFERTYGVAPFADFMLAFNTTIDSSSDFQVILDDKVFNTGILKFTYQTADILNLPKLITQ